MDPNQLWAFFLPGYLLSIAVETPILLAGLSARHSVGRRLFAGIWLTACTYPVVILVLPLLLDPSKLAYLIVAETYAPVAECIFFWLAFGTKEEWGQRSMVRDMAVIIVANLASFGVGELVHWMGWL
jgi:hypothetical protein